MDCEVSQASILAFIPRLEPSKGTGCPFGKWICSSMIEARPEVRYSFTIGHERTRWPCAQQKAQKSGRGRKKEVGAPVLAGGATGTGVCAVVGALQGCGIGGGGALA